MKKDKFKPIFHQYPCSRWLPNTNKMDTNDMKSTWPMRAPMGGDPTRPPARVGARVRCYRSGGTGQEAQVRGSQLGHRAQAHNSG